MTICNASIFNKKIILLFIILIEKKKNQYIISPYKPIANWNKENILYLIKEQLLKFYNR